MAPVIAGTMAAAPNGGGAYGTPEYTPFTSAHMINFEWLQHGGGANQIFPASADLMDAAGRTVITSYAVHRPDGNWSLMLINHDLNAAHPIHLVIDDAKHVSHSFAGSVSSCAVLQHPGENKNTTMAPAARRHVYSPSRVDHRDSREGAVVRPTSRLKYRVPLVGAAAAAVLHNVSRKAFYDEVVIRVAQNGSLRDSGQRATFQHVKYIGDLMQPKNISRSIIKSVDLRVGVELRRGTQTDHNRQ